MNDNTDFGKGKIFPMILKYSIPAAVSLLITAIYNIVDRIFIGNFNGSAGGSTLFTLFRGKNDTKSANAAFASAFILTIILEAALTVLLLLFSDVFLKIFGVTETTPELALQYYNIIALGCVFQGLNLVFCDCVRVSDKPVPGMCVTGIGQLVSAIFGAWLLFKGRTLVKTGKGNLNINRKISWRLLSCGFAFWIAQMAMGFIALVYYGQLGTYRGDAAISVYVVVSSVMTFIIMPASGISQGVQPLIGYNYSTGNAERVSRVFLQAALFSMGVTLVIWALRANFILAPVLGFVMLAATFFQSIGKPAASSVITLIRQVAALVPFIYLLPRFFGSIGIFYAQPLSDLLATLLAVVLIAVEFKRLPQLRTVQSAAARGK